MSRPDPEGVGDDVDESRGDDAEDHGPDADSSRADDGDGQGDGEAENRPGSTEPVAPVTSTDRRSRVGEPVVRADPDVTGERASEAVDFDPDDPESVAHAAAVLAEFAGCQGEEDCVDMLRGAAACAALVRGTGSYRAASERADGVPVSFIRTWARVHDLPQSIRRHVARGNIAPSAAKHLARVDGTARLDLAWALLDHDLTVREVRALASRVTDGDSATEALRDEGVALGDVDLSLSVAQYRELRREASMRNATPGDVVSEALAERYD